jgi:LmbE family N-acetylglucosaminyl deacetylase
MHADCAPAGPADDAGNASFSNLAGMSRAFDPNSVGADEQQWPGLLAGGREWRPTCAHLLIVAPHPDDEILGAGGLIRACAMAGRKVTVLSVTDGEAADASRGDLGTIRRQELLDALRKLSRLHVQVERLGLPDGSVAQHANRLHNAILSLREPDTTLVAPYERDGHPDHEAAGRVSLGISDTHAVPTARYPIWAWHHTDPQSLKHTRWVRFSLSEEARRAKRRAIQCFESQLRPPSGTPIVPAHVLEHFDRPYEAFIV